MERAGWIAVAVLVKALTDESLACKMISAMTRQLLTVMNENLSSLADTAVSNGIVGPALKALLNYEGEVEGTEMSMELDDWFTDGGSGG